MLHQFEYREAHEEVIAILIEMKKHLDWYKQQSFFNERTHQRQIKWIRGFANYIKASKGAFTALEAEIEASYQEGLQRGKQLYAPKENHNWRGFTRYSDVLKEITVSEETLHRYAGKEATRQLTIEKAKLDFPNLY